MAGTPNLHNGIQRCEYRDHEAACLSRPGSHRSDYESVDTGKALVPLSLKLVSIPNFQDWHDQSSSLSAMAYYQSFEASIITGSQAEYARAARVSPEFFRVFAVEPVIGHLFSPDETKLGAGAMLI